MWKPFVLLLCFSLSTTLNAQTKVLAFAGSTRTDSVNKKLLMEATCIAREIGADVNFIDLKDYPLPLYDADLEAKNGMPEIAKEIRRLMIKSHVIVIASPEYNGSLSAVLKNTIDWASRNETKGSSREAFKGKKFIVMSASPGSHGGSRGLAHLRTILEDIGGTVIPEQVVVPDAYSAFDIEGKLRDKNLYADLKYIIESSIVSSQKLMAKESLGTRELIEVSRSKN